jgi:TonB family protein
VAVDHLVGGRCDVLIVDLGSLRGDVAALIVRLQAQFPELIVMATGRREEEGAFASLISSGSIYRFLHKPVSPPRASQFLNAATRRHNELRDVQPVAMQTVRMIARKRPYLSKALLAAAGSGVLAAVIAFVIWQSQDTSLPATMQTTQVSDVPVEDVVKSKLGSAQIAYLSGRLIDPRGDNALEYYKAVLALHPENAEAKAGMQKVTDTLEQRVVKALQERNAARVVTAWTALQRAAPTHPRLDALRKQLLALSRTAPKTPSVEVPAAVANTPATDPLPASSAETDLAERELAEAIGRELAEQEAATAAAPSAPQEPSLADEVAAIAALLERGALIAPPGNNAFESLLALSQRYPEAEEVRSEQQRLAFVLLDRSRTALASNDLDAAETMIDRANTFAPSTQAVRALQEQLVAAQQERDFTRNIAQAATLKRVREVPPEYPREAARAGTEGWVQVEFTIAPDGTTQDLQVLDSAPQVVFDRAALDSVSKWRFEPIRKNGAPVAQRAVLQVRFVLNN